MDQLFHVDKTFDKIVYAEKRIKGREFQDCIFNKCDFANSDFSHNKFIDCSFEDCNLSMMKLHSSSMNNVAFKNCKVLGILFSECHDFLFSVTFDTCLVDYSSFMGKKMLKTHFRKCSLKEVNFTQVSMASSDFDESDLSGAIFNKTDLTGTDFQTAFNFTIDPELNLLKNAKFSLSGLPGLLEKYKIQIV